MKRTLSLIILSIITSLACGLTPILSATAAAATPESKAKSEICQGAGLFSGTSDTTASGNTSSCGDSGAAVAHALTVAINLLSIIVGVAAVVMIIVGGLRFITAGGDSGKVTSARTGIVYAIIGLVIVVFAQAIVHFVLAKFQ